MWLLLRDSNVPPVRLNIDLPYEVLFEFSLSNQLICLKYENKFGEQIANAKLLIFMKRLMLLVNGAKNVCFAIRQPGLIKS